MRLVASGVKSSLAGLTVLSGGLAVPLTALGYGAVGLAQGGPPRRPRTSSATAPRSISSKGASGARGIKTVVHQILAEAKADSVVDRLRDDLKRRVVG